MKTDKSSLVRGLVTKICAEKKIPEVRFDRWFLSEADWKILDYLRERKNDLPSVEYLEKTFKFIRSDSECTVTDNVELLNNLFVKESVAVLFEQVRETYSRNGDTISNRDVLQRLQVGAMNANSVISQTNTTSFNDVDFLADKYEIWSQLKDPIETGFDRIDIEAPFRRGELVCLIGGTGGGKSLTVQKMFAHNIKTSTAATLISLEMDDVQVLSRVLPILEEGKTTHSDIRFAKLSKEEFKKRISKYGGNYNIVTRKTGLPIKISTIEAHLEEQQAKGKPVSALYIDYIGLLDQDRAWNAEESISGQLKRLALQYNCMIMILVQADTATVQSKAMPGITSIAENKGIARDCDIVFALKSERNNDKENTLTVEYDFLKRRSDGNYISLSMKVNPETGSWKETWVATP